jgi:lysophospholipase L1-like esterase
LANHSHSVFFYLRKIAKYIAIFVVVCVALEFTYRLINRHSFSLALPTWAPDPDLLYKLNPADPQYPESFRGKAPVPTRHAAYRIVCLGGSTTYAHALKAEEAWPAVLERTLKARGIDAEVINAAVPGYGSRQLLLRYRRDIVPLHPDFVIVYEGWNRAGGLVDPGGFNPPRNTMAGAEQYPERTIKAFLLRHSLIVQKIYTGLNVRREGSTWSVDAYPNVFIEDFTKLMEEIKEHNSQPVLILYPALYFRGMTAEEQASFGKMLWLHRTYQPDMLTELENKHGAIRAIAEATSTPMVDLSGNFSATRGEGRKKLFRDEMHMSVRGNQQAGEFIAGFMDKLIRKRSTATPPVKPAP